MSQISEDMKLTMLNPNLEKFEKTLVLFLDILPNIGTFSAFSTLSSNP
jgi:hypothetical protein